MEGHHLRTRRVAKDLVELICRECHKTIHGLFSQADLRDPRLELDSIEGLLENDRFKTALVFIKKVRPGDHMKMRQANTRRKRR